MDLFVRAEVFREKGQRQGLISRGHNPTAVFPFWMDLNQGQICIRSDALSVAIVVQIARSFAEDAQYGEHTALLNLVARRSNLERGGIIRWERDYYVHSLEEYVSLRQWLIEQFSEMLSKLEQNQI